MTQSLIQPASCSMFEDDEDSLFGSPPPSPARGRSPAFPAQAAQERGAGITQNVGAIALPGSHMSCSELPADLLALPFGSFNTREPPPSHALPVKSTLQAPQSPRVASSVPFSTSRPSSRATGKRKTTKSQSATPRPAPPPIPFPGPDEPLPSNFLRNQEALLGIAGLVGNVKPTSLPQQTIRGSTPSNPIIIEESDPTRLPHVDPSQLTSLIRQKTIFPVLSSIMKLLGNSPAASTQPLFTNDCPSSRQCSEPATTAPPPLKRRKLTSVPAGAVEWDVPYPFPEGEGPKAYHATWERERARHLITQLVESIKAAFESSPLDDDQVPPSSSQSSMRTSEPSRHTSSPSPVSPTTTNTFQHIIPDCTIDPALLAISVPPSVTYNASSPVPALVHSPITSTESSDGALTPPAYNDQDSVAAAKMLLQFATRPVVPSPAPSHIDISPAVLTSYPQTTPSCFSPLTHLQSVSPQISRSPSVQSMHKPTPSVPRRAGFKAAHKEDILHRARERRRQIVGEIERAKVELWETSIEGGVLGHLMKDPTLS
ncbi:hypothetical protein DFJ58DRAFT_67017 [Suillus subalutaceus]|uniref:uncharacterized protein n=2 Tax=Suillus subalutaceus TaxID=48586 RepID=UPI001B87C3E4|nr:uncharacterized protein DFJ58DRAFT_67017 [Suillus subalutaceus]KAG1842031.1 hypothetical protein DFJ58DRAFT_67017 [Suillus subalutaceus]